MERRNQIVWGAAGSILAIIFIALLVRSCGRQETASETSGDGGEVNVAVPGTTSQNMQPCDADPKTGLCYPRSGNVVADTFNMHSFTAQVRAFRSSSASGSLFRVYPVSSTRPTPFHFGSSVSSKSSANFSVPAGFRPVYRGSDSATTEIIRTSSFGRTSSGRTSSFAVREAAGEGGQSESHSSTRLRSSGDGTVTDDGNIDSGEESADENEFNGSDDGGAVTIVESDTSVATRSGVGRCDRSRSLLSIFDFGELSTGDEGWTFPVLLNGDCPVTAAMIKVDKSGGFGGSLDDF